MAIYGEYSIVLLPITLFLSNANKELGAIDECYGLLNKAFKIAYFNNDFNSIEVLEVLNNFVLFSKYINETNEEGVYSEVIGKILQKNLINLDYKNKKLTEKIKLNNKEKHNKDNKDHNSYKAQDKTEKINKNQKKIMFENFELLPFENKLETLLQLSYYLKHIDHLSTYGKIGKNTQFILKKFNYCNEILEVMGILNDSKSLNFDIVFKSSFDCEIKEIIFQKDFKIEENFIFFYMNPDLKEFLNYQIAKIQTDKTQNKNYNNKNNNNSNNNKDFKENSFLNLETNKSPGKL